MSTTNKRKAPSATYNAGEAAYLLSWVADGTAPGAPKLVFVSIIDSKHDFEKGGWIHKVRSPELSASVAFEVHESQLSRGAKYKKGQQVHVSGVRWRREVLQTAVIKAVKAQDHSFTYDLAIEMKDVEPTEIVGSLGTMVQVDD